MHQPKQYVEETRPTVSLIPTMMSSVLKKKYLWNCQKILKPLRKCVVVKAFFGRSFLLSFLEAFAHSQNSPYWEKPSLTKLIFCEHACLGDWLTNLRGEEIRQDVYERNQIKTDFFLSKFQQEFYFKLPNCSCHFFLISEVTMFYTRGWRTFSI